MSVHSIRSHLGRRCGYRLLSPRTPLFGVLIAAAFACPAARAEPVVVFDLEAPTDLLGTWRFRPGDDPEWADPALDETSWSSIAVPGPWNRQGYDEVETAWYRKAIRLPAAFFSQEAPPLGIRMGEVFAAYELYAGGMRIGSVGALPPEAELAYDRHAVFALPRSAVDDQGRLVLALRVWRAPPRAAGLGGVTRGPIEIGPLDLLVRRAERSQVPALVLAALFGAIGFYHLWLASRRRSQTAYLWFGLFALGDAVFTLVRTQWRFTLFGEHFVAIKEVEYLARYLLPALAIQFLWPFFGRPIGRWLRAYQLSHVALAVAVAVTPGLTLNLQTVRASEIWVAPLILAVIAVVAVEAWHGNPDGQIIGVGAALLGMTYLVDIAVGRGLLDLPYISNFGFAALVFSMALSLGNRFRRVHQQLDGLRLGLEEQVDQRTRELRAATARAVAASQAKSAFLAHLSHELRTPMTGIVGMSGLFGLTELDETQREYLATIQTSTRSLERLVEDVLDFSRVESGSLPLVSHDFDPVALVDQAADAVRPQAEQAGLELLVTIDDDLPPRLEGDPERIRQVLGNLLGNAVKFTERGQVEVIARAEPDASGMRLILTVRDTGVGIPRDRQKSIFEPFAQAESSLSRVYGGAGLGLAIAQRLATLMDGTLDVESAPGVGSRFTFQVPVGAAQAASLLMPPARPVGASPSRAIRVLVAEDDPVNQAVMVRMLEQLDLEVEVARDGREALSALEAKAFDLVLMDCRMPRLDGLSATRKIREREREGHHLPIVGITAFARSSDRDQCLAAGMDDYLAKPYRLEDLLLVIDRWLPQAVDALSRRRSDARIP